MYNCQEGKAWQPERRKIDGGNRDDRERKTRY